MKTIDKINLQIQRVLDVFLGAASVVMLAVNLAQVLGRYVFHSSITWSEELSTYMYVWIIFLALYAACRERNELGIEVLRLKDPKGRRTVLMVRELLGLAACAAFLYGSVLMIRNSLAFPQKTPSLKIITAYLYFCMPLSFTLLVWMKAVHIIHDIRFLSGRETDEAGTGK